MYKLVISDDEGKTTVVPLIRDEITIGRKEGNTIRLTDRNVSRFHARVIRQDDDTFLIEDMGSLCGTNVNNDILRSQRHVISSGDKISIGDYSLSIRSDVGADVPMGRQMDPGSQTGIGKVTPHARLVMVSSPTPGFEVELTAELYVIGRSEEANCRLDHPSISRAHARIDFDAGKWTISDLDSVNGIQVNGLRKDDYVLKAGDVIRLGMVDLRYVAPGEPYDYVSPDTQPEPRQAVVSSPAKKKRRFLIPILVSSLLVVGAFGVGAFVYLRRDLAAPAEGHKDDGEKKEDTVTFESLMNEGRDKMQGEEWGEAARLFALAQQKDPSSQGARELKLLCIREADAQAAFADGLAAQANKSWEDAMGHLSKIPPSSHYYDAEQLQLVAGKLCDELLETASFIQKTGVTEDLDQAIANIQRMENAPDRCRGTEEELLERIARRALEGLSDSEGDEVVEQPIRARGNRTTPRRAAKTGLRINGNREDAKDVTSEKKDNRKPMIENPYDNVSNPYDE